MEPIWRKHWPRGLPYSLNYPEIPIWKVLEGAARKHPDKPGIIFMGYEYSYGHLWEMAEKCAAALQKLGVARGDVVALHLPNCPQFLIAYYGLLRAGAVFNPCNPTLSARELIYQLNDCGARVIITLDLLLPLVREVKEKTRLQKVIVTGMQEAFPPYAPLDFAGLGEGYRSFAQVINEATPNPDPAGIDPGRDVAHLAYTGGTTGVSKGVMITHFNATTNFLQYAAWFSGGVLETEDGLVNIRQVGEDPGDDHWEYPVGTDGGIGVVVAPWFHAMGTIGYLNEQIAMGTTLVVHPRLDARTYLEDVQKYGATFIGGAPPLFVALLSVPGIENLNLSTVQTIVSGAAPLAVELLEKLNRFFPGAVVVEAYGLTEATMGATSNPSGWRALRKNGTVGLPVFDTEVRIVDLEEGKRDLAPGETGEICIRGPQVMKGYLNRPEATAEVIRDGWLHTGDIGTIDPDGYVSVLDRLKDMLIYKGYNVYPRELEELLFQHPAVANCTVIGKPDPVAGEIPKAFVELKKGSQASEKEIMDFVADRVAAYKRIREVDFVDDLPVSLAGKVLKRLLREREAAR